jgi:hypothetical protein
MDMVFVAEEIPRDVLELTNVPRRNSDAGDSRPDVYSGTSKQE